MTVDIQILFPIGMLLLLALAGGGLWYLNRVANRTVNTEFDNEPEPVTPWYAFESRSEFDDFSWSWNAGQRPIFRSRFGPHDH